MNNHKPDPSVLPCIGCRGTFPDCRHACGDLDAHHAWQDRQRLHGAADTLMGIFGYTRVETSATNIGTCPAEGVYVREVAG